MVETTKDAEKNSLKETAIREEKEAVAATRPQKRDDLATPADEQNLAADVDASGEGETLAEKRTEEALLSDLDGEGAASSEREPLRQSLDEDDSFQDGSSDKHRVEFFGSELLRARAPKAFEVADAVVDDWVKDGRFEGLPVGHPLLQLAAQMGLRKAKDVEKKLDEKGVFLIARTGLEYLKAKINKK